MSETDCVEILEQIEIYLDRELPDDARCAEIKRHLNECPHCLDRAEFRSSLKILIETKCAGNDLPDGLQERILEAIHAESS